MVVDGERSMSGRPLALVPNAVELAAQAAIREMRAGGASLRETAAELDRLGIVPKRGGGRWSHSAVVRLPERA